MHALAHCKLAPSAMHLLVQFDTRVVVALSGNHHVCLIQYEDSDFRCIEELVAECPVDNLSRCTNDDVSCQLFMNCNERRGIRAH